MALTINNNLMALMAGNNLASTYTNLAKSVNALSSGLRINSAADDAAGLAVRELMRSDITVLKQGIRNANDAISMLQTMDGAASVIDEKLIRMKELAEQAATGTYTTDQRTIMNDEFSAMRDEIERIATATEFNGVHMIDGQSAGSVAQVLEVTADTLVTASGSAFVSAFTQYTSGEQLSLSYTDHDGDTGTVSMTLQSATTITQVMSWINSTPTDVRQTLKVTENQPALNADSNFISAFTGYANGELLTMSYTNNDGSTGEVSRTIAADTTIQDVLNWINLGTSAAQELTITANSALSDTSAFVSAFTNFASGDTLTISWLDHNGGMHVDTSAVTSSLTIGDVETWIDGLGAQFSTAYNSATGELTFTDATAGASKFAVSITGGTAIVASDYNATITNAGADDTTDVELTATWTNGAGAGLALADDTAGYSQAAASFGGGATYDFAINAIGKDATADLGMTAAYSSTSGFTLTDDTSAESQIAATLTGGGSYAFTVGIEGEDQGGDEVKIHFGTGNDSAEDYYYITKQDMTSEGLGIDSLDISTQSGAQSALGVLDEAIKTKDQSRAHFGSMINRLENTVTNLTIQAENIQAAESQISDIDVAFEMSNFINQQIKAQAAVAMLSQANTLPQMALSLLGG